MRPDSEAYQLTWNDVDFENNALNIKGDPAAFKNDRQKQSAKDQGEGRQPVMNDKLKELLAKPIVSRCKKGSDKVVTVEITKKAMKARRTPYAMTPRLTRSDNANILLLNV